MSSQGLIESAHRRDGWWLRCPACGAWSRELLLVDAGRLACRRCHTETVAALPPAAPA